jgi:hypothetical protein
MNLDDESIGFVIQKKLLIFEKMLSTNKKKRSHCRFRVLLPCNATASSSFLAWGLSSIDF